MGQDSRQVDEFLLRTIPASLTETPFQKFVLDSFEKFPLSIQRVIVQNQTRGGEEFVSALNPLIMEREDLIGDAVIAGELRASSAQQIVLSEAEQRIIAINLQNCWYSAFFLIDERRESSVRQAEALLNGTEQDWHRLRDGAGENADALRNVAWWVLTRGTLFELRGSAQQAGADYGESLAHFEQVLEIVGQDQPQALRDVSVSLERIGDILRAKGDTEGAIARFQRSLGIREQVLEIVGQDQPQALRDVSVSLERIGDILRAKGDTEGAIARFQRSLGIREQVLEIVGQDQPEALRDVSVSLNKIGDILKDKGDTEEAITSFQRSLKIFEQVLEIVGEDQPHAVVDWCMCATRLATIALDTSLAEQSLERMNLVVARYSDQVFFHEVRHWAERRYYSLASL
ncbi:NrfG FOG, TPR repeat [Fimbriimonadaceae bacterium]